MNYMIALKGHVLEFVEEGHTYIIDGVIVPSITEILSSRFGKKYAGVDKSVLIRAADKGKEVHAAIEAFCTDGTPSDLPEVRNFIFLQDKYGFHVLGNEIPVILFDGDKPIAAGRLDLILIMDGQIGGADIKRTSSLDKEYVAYQLNLYRIAYRQCYGDEWKFLRAIHLRDNVRRFVELPINEKAALELVADYMKGKKDEPCEFDW